MSTKTSQYHPHFLWFSCSNSPGPWWPWRLPTWYRAYPVALTTAHGSGHPHGTGRAAQDSGTHMGALWTVFRLFVSLWSSFRLFVTLWPYFRLFVTLWPEFRIFVTLWPDFRLIVTLWPYFRLSVTLWPNFRLLWHCDLISDFVTLWHHFRLFVTLTWFPSNKVSLT